jgi:hypothetical protein
MAKTLSLPAASCLTLSLPLGRELTPKAALMLSIMSAKKSLLVIVNHLIRLSYTLGGNAPMDQTILKGEDDLSGPNDMKDTAEKALARNEVGDEVRIGSNRILNSHTLFSGLNQWKNLSLLKRLRSISFPGAVIVWSFNFPSKVITLYILKTLSTNRKVVGCPSIINDRSCRGIKRGIPCFETLTAKPRSLLLSNMWPPAAW